MLRAVLCLLVFAMAFQACAANIVLNPSFEAGFDDWNNLDSSLTSGGAHTGTYSAHLELSKTAFTQQLLKFTPSGCYDFVFWAKQASDWQLKRNQLDVQFNHVEMTGSGGLNSLPIKNGILLSGVGGWAKFSYRQCITSDQADELADLRIRFHGMGYLIDDVSVVGPFCGTPTDNFNLGFELGNLDCWSTYGPDVSQIKVLCDGTQKEGLCYAELGTAGTVGGTPGTDPNELARQNLAIINTDPVMDNSYHFCFWHRFKTLETSAFWNDYFRVKVVDSDGMIISDHTLDVADNAPHGGTTPWVQHCVDIGPIKAQKAGYVSISATVRNFLDGAVSSYGDLDGISYTPI